MKPSTPLNERRRWPRLPLAIPLFVRSRDENGKEALEFASALNVSAGGALIAVRRSLPLSTRVSLEIPTAPLLSSPELKKTTRFLHAKALRVTHSEDYHLLALEFANPLAKDANGSGRTRRKSASVV